MGSSTQVFHTCWDQQKHCAFQAPHFCGPISPGVRVKKYENMVSIKRNIFCLILVALVACNEKQEFGELFDKEIISIEFKPTYNFENVELRIAPVVITTREKIEKLKTWATSGEKYSRIDTHGFYKNLMIVRYRDGTSIDLNISCPLKEKGGIIHKHYHYLVAECPDFVEFKKWRERYEVFTPTYDITPKSR